MAKALVIGKGISGKSAVKLLKGLGVRTYVVDDKQKFKTNLLKERIFKDLDFIVVSPGVELSHKLIQEAKERGVEVMGELELACRYLISDNIAITGTNGKTTTTSLVYHILQGGERNVFVGGNIGIPVSSFALKSTMLDITAIEVSSFQLETIIDFKPKIACLLNITPDHLNRHKTMENYIRTKMRIFENQESQDFAVFNLDDKEISKLDLSSINAQKYYFSTRKKCKGCYFSEGKIFYNDGKQDLFVMNSSEIPLKGEHNLSNALASILCAILIGANPEQIRQRIHNFKGAKHRLEYVSEINGVTFINDSKATNISSAKVAMNAMTEHFSVILGGSDKGYEFDELFIDKNPLLKNVVVIGETKAKLLSAITRCGVSNVYEANSLKEAVNIAYQLSNSGETVLLSPACASFDMFTDYTKRGECFIKVVRELKRFENYRSKSKKE